MGARHALLFCVVTAATSCTLLYAGYDERFQGAGAVPFATEDGGSITAMAVTTADLFYAVNSPKAQPTIRRKPLDGGNAVTFWTSPDDAGVRDLVTDGTTHVAWSQTNQKLWISTTDATSDAASPYGTIKIAANSQYVAWIHSSLNGRVAQALPWQGGPALDLVLQDASTPASISVDDKGIDVFLNGLGLARFGTNGSLQCMPSGRTPYALELASAPSGSPLYEITAMQVTATSGSLQVNPAFLAPNCATNPSASFGPVTVADQVIATDDAAAYWAAGGSLMMARFGDDGGTQLDAGVTISSTGPVAVGAAFVYVVDATGASIYAVSKPTHN